MDLVIRALRFALPTNEQLALFALVLLAVGAPGISAQAPDLSGEWVFTVQSPNGTGTRQATLVQRDDSVMGTISSHRATGDVIGVVEGDVVRLTALLMMASGPFEVVYEAEFTDSTMTGTVDFGDYGDGTFTGRRVDGARGDGSRDDETVGTLAVRGRPPTR